MKNWGVSFKIPDGWIGQESEGMYYNGLKNTKAGLIIIQPHQFNIHELRQQGLCKRYTGGGRETYFQLEGELQVLKSESQLVGVTFQE